MQSTNYQRPAYLHGTTTGAASNPVAYNTTVPYGHLQFQGGAHSYNLPQSSSARQDTNNLAMDSLSQGFSNGLHLGPAGSTRPVSYAMPATTNLSHLNPVQAAAPMYYQLTDGRVLLSNLNTSQGTYPQQYAGYNLTPLQTQFLPQTTYNGLASTAANKMPNTPQGVSNRGWTSNQNSTKELPDLAAPRRNSWSSNEETGPRTPFVANMHGDYQPAVALSDRWTPTGSTPSPLHMVQNYADPPILKASNEQYHYVDLHALTQRHPAIPRAIAAPFSVNNGRGTIEKSLVNTEGTTNVYIRGLHPNTTDEMLAGYGERFGEIYRDENTGKLMAKAIIENSTGDCKGYGFIQYNNFTQSENCIRGFYHLGYEAKFARASYNQQLKALWNEGNTNLYISNLPRDMNEHELSIFFHGYDVKSHKIHRDSNGISRGVGFARFETPMICEEVIKNFHGQKVVKDGVEYEVQIRYADNDAQKELKKKTAERRQFKANEYDVAVYGPASPYFPRSPASASYSSSLDVQPSMVNGMWLNQSPVSPTVYGYAQTAANFPIQAATVMTGFRAPQTENQPPVRTRYSARIKIESPHNTTITKGNSDEEAIMATPSSNGGQEGRLCKTNPTTPYGSTSEVSPSKSLA